MNERSERYNSQDATDSVDPHTHGTPPWLPWMWRRQTLLLGIAVSLFIHAAVMLLAALVYLNQPASANQGDGEVELAVMTDAELTELMQSAVTSDMPTVEEIPQEDLFSVEDFSTPVSDSSLASLEISDLGDFGGAGSEFGEGMDVGSSAGGSARFFGVEARGSRFAYICDVSGSMEGSRLDQLKRELIASIDDLLEHTDFAIILYNSDSLQLTGKRWLDANDRYKDDAIKAIRTIRAMGGTVPLPAFVDAFGMKPTPDAIYFMTDGMFEDAVVGAIGRLNENADRRTPIHCITFGPDARAPEVVSMMRRIARHSGGSYTHVEGAVQ